MKKVIFWKELAVYKDDIRPAKAPRVTTNTIQKDCKDPAALKEPNRDNTREEIRSPG